MRTQEARWFKVVLDRASAPWAYRRGEPFRVIAALELLGTLLSIKVFIAKGERVARAMGKISAGASTDNQGNRFVLNRFMTTKFPLLAFVCETAAELEEKDCLLDLGWVPRDQNQEADAITNDNLGEFRKANKVEVCLKTMDFKVLRELLDLGDTFYEAREKEREVARAAAAAAAVQLTRKQVQGGKRKAEKLEQW